MTKHARRWAALAAAGLIGAALPIVAFSGTSYAAEGCEHEYNPVQPLNASSQYTCDDVTQPDTSLQVDSVPNTAGWLNKNSVTFTFAAVAPGDPDQPTMTLRCSFTGPSQAFAEKDCTSPLTVTGLTDSAEPYTFSVHAVDDGGFSDLNGDNEVTNSPLDLVTPAEVVTKDYDESPATITWRQDTVVPRGLIVGGPYDELTPEFPVLWSRTTKYTLGSSEQPVTATCSLNSRSVPCSPGVTTLTGLAAGTKTFSMRLKDKADNLDPLVRTKKFTVPYNVLGTTTELYKWKRFTATGYFGGDYLQTKQKNAQLTRTVSFHELRILVPKGPGLGRFRIKVGDYFFRIISEASATASHEEVVLRGPQSTLMSGVLKLYTLDAKPVQFDAIMYR